MQQKIIRAAFIWVLCKTKQHIKSTRTSTALRRATASYTGCLSPRRPRPACGEHAFFEHHNPAHEMTLKRRFGEGTSQRVAKTRSIIRFESVYLEEGSYRYFIEVISRRSGEGGRIRSFEATDDSPLLFDIAQHLMLHIKQRSRKKQKQKQKKTVVVLFYDICRRLKAYSHDPPFQCVSVWRNQNIAKSACSHDV